MPLSILGCSQCIGDCIIENKKSKFTNCITGSGPAGISTAYHLSKLAKQANESIEITIFEKKSVIGGRLALEPIEEPLSTKLSEFFGHPRAVREVQFSMEAAAGATMLHSSPTLLDIAKELGMDHEVYTEPLDIAL